MKNLLFLLLVLPLAVTGQNIELQANEELRLIDKLYYDQGAYIASEKELSKLNELIFEMRADSTVKIHIIGYTDKWETNDLNDKLSFVRAKTISDWMRSCRVPREQILFVGNCRDTLSLDDAENRRVEVSQIVKVAATPEPDVVELAVAEDARAAEPTEEMEIDPQMQVEPEPIPVPTPAPAPIQQPEIQPTPEPKVETHAPVAAEENNSSLKTQNSENHISLRTNLLYWLGGIMNVGAEYRGAESNFGVALNAGYSCFGNTNWYNNFGGWFVAPELRYYIPNHEQWFVGVQILAGGFNLKFDETGRQGYVVGGGVMGGYKFTLTNRFDLDFTLGVGYGHFNDDTYYHNRATNTNHYITQDITKNSIMPIQGGVNLIWKIK